MNKIGTVSEFAALAVILAGLALVYALSPFACGVLVFFLVLGGL